jgi:hypothetical protein
MASMSQEIDAFLAAYKPKDICFPCPGEVTAREPADVKQAVDALILERRAETQVGECLNCNATAFVVRRR